MSREDLGVQPGGPRGVGRNREAHSKDRVGSGGAPGGLGGVRSHIWRTSRDLEVHPKVWEGSGGIEKRTQSP